MRGLQRPVLPTPVRPSVVASWSSVSAPALKLGLALRRAPRARWVLKTIDAAQHFAFTKVQVNLAHRLEVGEGFGNAPAPRSTAPAARARHAWTGEKPHCLASSRRAGAVAGGGDVVGIKTGARSSASHSSLGAGEPAKDGDGPHAVIHHCGNARRADGRRDRVR